MSTYYFDTSALVKLYVAEEGTERAVELTQSADSRPAMLDLARVEFRSALRRRQTDGDVSAADANLIAGRLDQDMAQTILVQPSSPPVLEEAIALIDRHTLRAYDALQLAGALILQPAAPSRVCFVCSDQRLLAAARAEGLPALDPAEEYSEE